MAQWWLYRTLKRGTRSTPSNQNVQRSREKIAYFN